MERATHVAAAVLALTVWTGAAGAQTTGPDRTRQAIEAARTGNVILLCRHAATTSFRETEPLDYDDPSTQRRLSRAGREQSTTLGRALAAAGVRVVDVVASPVDRAVRTAELVAGPPRIDSIWHTNDGDYRGIARTHRLEALRRPVPDGVRLIVSHIGTMGSVVPQVRGRVGEGDCAVVRPGPDSHRLIGIVPDTAWTAAGRPRQNDRLSAPNRPGPARGATRRPDHPPVPGRGTPTPT